MAGSPSIISLEDFSPSINMLLYGVSGVGKTVLAGTAPKALFLGIEDGQVSAKRRGSKADLWPVTGWQDLSDAYDWLYENSDSCGYQWVIIDSVTVMQKLCMRGILDRVSAENAKRDPDIPAQADWQKYYNMFDRFVTGFCDLPINVLFIASEMRHENDEGEQQILPALVGPSYDPMRESEKLCAAMMVVAHMRKNVIGGGKNLEEAKTTRQLLFEGMPPYFAKDRYDVFPRLVTVTDQEGKMITTMDSITKRIDLPTDTPARPAKRLPGKPAVKAVPAKTAPVRRRPVK
jgi:hypothetical protein